MSNQNPTRKSTTGETGSKGEFGTQNRTESPVALARHNAPTADQANDRYYGMQPDTINRFSRGRQDYTLERILTLPATDRVPEQTLRATLVKDSIVSQSSSVIELWTNTGWVEVDRIRGYILQGQLPDVPARNDEHIMEKADDFLTEQILGAIRIIG